GTWRIRTGPPASPRSMCSRASCGFSPGRGSGALGGAKPGRAGARVAENLVLAGPHRTPSKKAKARVAMRSGGTVTRHSGRRAARAEKTFDLTVFERMKRNHH